MPHNTLFITHYPTPNRRHKQYLDSMCCSPTVGLWGSKVKGSLFGNEVFSASANIFSPSGCGHTFPLSTTAVPIATLCYLTPISNLAPYYSIRFPSPLPFRSPPHYCLFIASSILPTIIQTHYAHIASQFENQWLSSIKALLFPFKTKSKRLLLHSLATLFC